MSAPLFEFRESIADTSPPGLYVTFGKRALDLAVVVLLTPLAVPLIGFILLLTAMDGGRPLYSHLRVGRDGNLFRCWKVRTMVVDADAVLALVLRENPALAEEWARTQKLALDPRITRFGAFLRRTSLDELPQLWNVFCGSMSLVGPRPFLPEQTAMYLRGRLDADYYRMLPGITGLWLVSRRNQGSFAERPAYDAEYSDRIGLLTDLSILLRTVFVVMRATGV